MKFVFQLSVYNLYMYWKNRRELNHIQKINQKSWQWNDHLGLKIKSKNSVMPTPACKLLSHVSPTVKSLPLPRPSSSLCCTTETSCPHLPELPALLSSVPSNIKLPTLKLCLGLFIKTSPMVNDHISQIFKNGQF